MNSYDLPCKIGHCTLMARFKVELVQPRVFVQHPKIVEICVSLPYDMTILMCSIVSIPVLL